LSLATLSFGLGLGSLGDLGLGLLRLRGRLRGLRRLGLGQLNRLTNGLQLGVTIHLLGFGNHDRARWDRLNKDREEAMDQEGDRESDHEPPMIADAHSIS
jgi:hypothetical protein